ncbi:MAG: undecaprenyl/decaprenyl-phosphate alpha-N-acetylglucosaminyl 1-phosphate transferase [Candidatus Sumerlaeaceae bacterium]|nr:undecaprenyl/decaprenyl-phosphate alpha-N-acetylglucosaminyl 1-phosphate transferase [Candidatus Sumerlaeaceae bacterium]
MDSFWYETPLFPAMIVGFAVSYLGTYFVRGAMLLLGVLDIPTPDRKHHSKPVAYEGGIAIYLGFVCGLLYYAFRDSSSLFWRNEAFALIVGGTLSAALGAADDVLDVKPWVKFLGQLAIGAIMYHFGFRIERISNPFGAEVGLIGLLSLVGTVLWYALLMNGINMIDGVDGLAAGIVAISGITLGVIALDLDQPVAAVIAMIMTAACLGFLPYNFHPATIFMGDAGSLFLGYLLASLTLMSSSKTPALLTLAVPIVAVFLPLFETTFAFTRRLAKRQNPFRGDRSHLHHRFLDLGFSETRTVIILYYLTAYVGVIAYILQKLESRLTLIMAIFLAVGLFLLAESMGYLRRRQ